MPVEAPLAQGAPALGAAIDVRGLTKRFGKVAALTDVSFAVARGEILGLIGPNGSGKTTLLRCLTGLLLEDSGTSAIGGHDIHKDPIPARAMMAYLPEVPHPLAYLTPTEHLQFVARAYQLAPGWEARASTILEALDLTEKARSLAIDLSKGQKQKIHLAMAMLRDPQVLVLDEPLIGIDPKGAFVLKRWIKERAGAGAGGVVSSHSLALVEEVCHRVLVLAHGRPVVGGTFDELRRLAHAAPGASLEEVFLTLTAGR